MCFPISIYKVHDKSMEPSFHDGDYVIVSRWSTFGTGDVVVLSHPSKPIKLLKRISRIKSGRYSVVGDNAPRSIDSRNFGPVGKESIFGKVIAKI